MESQPGFDPARELETIKKNEAQDAEQKKRRKYITPYVNFRANNTNRIKVRPQTKYTISTHCANH